MLRKTHLRLKKFTVSKGEEGKAYNSAEEMFSVAQWMLGVHYADSSGTEKSYEQAEYWLKKSLEHAEEDVKKEVEEALKNYMLKMVNNLKL